MIRTIIIDDEQNIVSLISGMLNMYCSDIEIVATANNVRDGLVAITKEKPDLVLLDIKMPDGTGFDLIKMLSPINFKLIFITAFQEYAINAIKLSALDYLMKPIDVQDLILAIEKARKAIDVDDMKFKINALLSDINGDDKSKKIVLKTSENIYLIDIADIVRCQSDRGYTEFYLKDKKKLLVSKTMKEYAELLLSNGFLRVHHSHIINMNYFDYFEKADGGFVNMKDGSSIPVSARKKESLFKYFDKVF